MRYKPKSTAVLQIALGGLTDKMRVEVDRNIGVSACKDCWPTSEGDGVARESSHNNSGGAPSRKRSKGEQG